MVKRCIQPELEFRKVPKPDPARKLLLDEARCGIQRSEGFLSTLVVPEDTDFHESCSEVFGDVHATDGDETNSGILDFPAEDIGDLPFDQFPHTQCTSGTHGVRFPDMELRRVAGSVSADEVLSEHRHLKIHDLDLSARLDELHYLGQDLVCEGPRATQVCDPEGAALPAGKVGDFRYGNVEFVSYSILDAFDHHPFRLQRGSIGDSHLDFQNADYHSDDQELVTLFVLFALNTKTECLVSKSKGFGPLPQSRRTRARRLRGCPPGLSA